MITGAHSIVYASDAEAARAFFRDVLGLTTVDAGHGWLIFKSPPAELAVHPTGPPDSGRVELYLMCDDLAKTIADLRDKGVEVADQVEEAGWGRVTRVTVPGAGEIGLYEPLHPTAYDLD
ncbi:extradiol dioxygenase [Nocardia cyriacigeorgica]|uniref:Extradiol dioxygenase n=1 Tax=Nocardia cyriacigeorgica TaxID=135487 RepID=A0A6P1D470_9NOCA|nr:VOC family protein [Nocardia cyriacigeorgica]NEW41064.1 extradiol dioxygenase [Nocardia cyriacigeorgica]NEW44329.1 extradiol dioxygenase [Nocardia cyriacigeorgica]NEW52949.1 extradiol dioxygenase [Nocardia cyriacigeorgica]NEW55203.1 extradiol dioxygenase [Nocardia cyriacigeorgica]